MEDRFDLKELSNALTEYDETGLREHIGLKTNSNIVKVITQSSTVAETLCNVLEKSGFYHRMVKINDPDVWYDIVDEMRNRWPTEFKFVLSMPEIALYNAFVIDDVEGLKQKNSYVANCVETIEKLKAISEDTEEEIDSDKNLLKTIVPYAHQKGVWNLLADTAPEDIDWFGSIKLKEQQYIVNLVIRTRQSKWDFVDAANSCYLHYNRANQQEDDGEEFEHGEKPGIVANKLYLRTTEINGKHLNWLHIMCLLRTIKLEDAIMYPGSQIAKKLYDQINSNSEKDHLTTSPVNIKSTYILKLRSLPEFTKFVRKYYLSEYQTCTVKITESIFTE